MFKLFVRTRVKTDAVAIVTHDVAEFACDTWQWFIHYFLYVLHFEDYLDNSICWSELNSIGQKVEDDLSVPTFVTKDLLEVILVEWIEELGPLNSHFLHAAVRLCHTDALPDQSFQTEIAVHHCKRIVRELSLVHQVSEQSQHHLGLTLHILKPCLNLLSTFGHQFNTLRQLLSINNE